MFEPVRCMNDSPHDPHDIMLTIDYLCSGAFECGNLKHHKAHRIEKKLPARCPGVGTYLN